MSLMVIVSEGVEYVPITQEQYDRLYAAKEVSEKARFIAVENFRTWCVANKGVTTVEEGLRVCTPEELQAQYYAAGGNPPVGTLIPGYISMLVGRLRDRREQAQEALAKAPVAPVMPEDEEEDDDSAADND